MALIKPSPTTPAKIPAATSERIFPVKQLTSPCACLSWKGTVCGIVTEYNNAMKSGRTSRAR